MMPQADTPWNPGDFEADRLLLRGAIKAAGETALGFFRKSPRGWYKAPGQLVTEADIVVDTQLHDIVIGARPGDAWLSEERPDDASRHAARRVWVVDPIDGTQAFAKGKPEFTISVALVVGHEAMLGSVYDPCRGEMFEAVQNLGAWMNGDRLMAKDQNALEGARFLVSSTEMRKGALQALFPEVSFETTGSIALMLAQVAAGRFDAVVSKRGSSDWDLAAAQLLLREAGGWIADGEGRQILLNGETTRHQGLVAASSKALFAKVLERLGASGT